MKIKNIFILAVVFIELSLVTPANAECRLLVDAPKNHPAAYADRKTRCEGLYIRPVSASTQPILRGFHLQPHRYDLNADSLEIHVLGISSTKTHGLIQAKSMRPRHYYQMDTIEIGESGVYQWETNVLRHSDVSLGPHEMAVLFCDQECDNDQENVFRPVLVQTYGLGKPKGPYNPYIVLESEVHLASIAVTVKNLQDGSYLYNKKRLRRRSYPPDYPINIPLQFTESGRYSITIDTVTRKGAVGKLSFIAVIPPQVNDGYE